MNNKTRLIPLLVLLLAGFLRPAFAAEGKLTLDFRDTDINAVIEAVAKLTGRNFIIDPRVKGKVTVITHKALTKDEVYQVFLSLLKVHGFAAVPGTNATKIVPEVNAKQDTIRTVRKARFDEGDELVTEVIPIQHVAAAQLVPILRPLVPQRGHLAAYPQSNVLIISDSAANVARLSEIIARIDQAVNQEIEVIPLKNAVASEIVSIIKQLHPNTAKDKTGGITLVADDRTNSVLLGGDKARRLQLRALIGHMDIPLEISGNTTVIYLRYAKAKDLVPVLTGVTKTLGKAGKGAKTTARNDINIQADESSNALVINAPPNVLRSIRAVVRQLDIRRAQVLIEAIIAEVSYSKSSELGIQWAFDGTSGGEKNGPIGLLNFPNFGSGILGLLESPPAAAAAMSGLSIGLGSFNSAGDPQLAMLIRALAGDANTNILSTPSLVTLDNEEAKIVVGQNVPFITGQYANTGGGTTPVNPFQTIERQDVGLTLRIKPQINEGDAIKLEVDQEISSLANSTVGADLITNKRQITTNVMVDDGQILVLGGLIEDNLIEGEQKVPGLGDIPLVGWLFKYKSVRKTKTNLMAFIRPIILKNRAIQNQHTSRKYNYLREMQMVEKKQGLTLFRNQEIPVMEEFAAIPPLPPVYRAADRRTDIGAPPQEIN